VPIPFLFAVNNLNLAGELGFFLFLFGFYRSNLLQGYTELRHKRKSKHLHIEQVCRTKEIRIDDKVPSDIGLHEFLPLVVEKVPKVKTYKFFITENQIVLVNPQKEIAGIIK
jgi:hypothetical protein